MRPVLNFIRRIYYINLHSRILTFFLCMYYNVESVTFLELDMRSQVFNFPEVVDHRSSITIAFSDHGSYEYRASEEAPSEQRSEEAIIDNGNATAEARGTRRPDSSVAAMHQPFDGQ